VQGTQSPAQLATVPSATQMPSAADVAPQQSSPDGQPHTSLPPAPPKHTSASGQHAPPISVKPDRHSKSHTPLLQTGSALATVVVQATQSPAQLATVPSATQMPSAADVAPQQSSPDGQPHTSLPPAPLKHSCAFAQHVLPISVKPESHWKSQPLAVQFAVALAGGSGQASPQLRQFDVVPSCVQTPSQQASPVPQPQVALEPLPHTSSSGQHVLPIFVKPESHWKSQPLAVQFAVALAGAVQAPPHTLQFETVFRGVQTPLQQPAPN
jgi:hypothetical protein